MTDSAQGDSVVILFRGGRLPQWHQLDDEQRLDYERQHVDLMLSVSEQPRPDRHTRVPPADIPQQLGALLDHRIPGPSRCRGLDVG